MKGVEEGKFYMELNCGRMTRGRRGEGKLRCEEQLNDNGWRQE